MAQVLLRYDGERHWVRVAPKLVGHLFSRMLDQSEYNDRLKAAAPLMEAALRWLADHTPGSAELLRLMLLIVTCDGTVTGFALANPKLAGERQAARTMLEYQPAST